MYNPQNLNECEVEKQRRPRRHVDALMIFVGIVASLSSLPQVYKIWSTGSVEGISLLTQVIALVAVVCWFIYGLYIKNRPLSITSGLSTIILAVVTIQIILLS